MRKLLREPLVHFLLLGLALFLIHGLVSSKENEGETIIIDDYDVNNIIASWEMQWKRLPTDDELKNLIQQNIKQEIFYQEALKMNLDHNDEIIKRRLSQKMQFLSSDIASMNEPNEEEINSFYKDNLANYMSPNEYEMYQLIYSPDYHTNPKLKAEQNLTEISGTNPEMAKNSGDKMPFPFYFESVNDHELNRQLGSNFTQSLENLETDQWTGPIKSGFGYHLVYLVERKETSPIPLQEVKNEVIRDFEYENQRKMDEMIFDEFRKNYSIEFDLDPVKFDESFIKFLEDKESITIDDKS